MHASIRSKVFFFVSLVVISSACLAFGITAKAGVQAAGLHPCDHSTIKVNISEKVLYTKAEQAKGDATCEEEHIVENLS